MRRTICGTTPASSCSTHLGCIVCKRGSASANDHGCEPVTARVDMRSRSVGCAMRRVAIAAGLVISRCRQREESDGKVCPSSSGAKNIGTVTRIAATATRAVAVDKLDTADLTVLSATKSRVAVESEDTRVKSANPDRVRTRTLG